MLEVIDWSCTLHERNVLITGGLGFVGLEVTRQLSDRGYGLHILDNLSPQIHGQLPSIDPEILTRTGATLRRGDVVNREDLQQALEGVSYIIHLAAETGTGQSMYEIARYERVNSYGTALLLDVLANSPHQVKKIILSSSRSVYGEGQYRCASHGVIQPTPRLLADLKAGNWEVYCPVCAAIVQAVPTLETSIPKPASIYAATKLAQEELVRIACTALGIPFVTLRFQNVYGPGQSLKNPYTGILSIFSTRIRRGLNLPIFEDGMESRDFVHVADVARAILLSLESDDANGKVLNVGAGVPTSVRDVAELLIRVFGGASRVEVTGQFRLGDIRHCWADLAAIRESIGFQPQVEIEEGLRGFADWVRSQPLPDDRLSQANDELKSRGMMP